MAQLTSGSTYNRAFLLTQSADHITGLTGATPTVQLSKAGSTSFVTSTGIISEIGSGLYNIGLTPTDTNTIGDLAFHITAGSADPTDFVDQVTALSNIRKNMASTGFTFVMTNSSAHAPSTGFTVTGARSIDGGAFASLTNSVAEVANGTYRIDLSTADTNGNHLMLRFTATGADDLNIAVITVPSGG